MQKFLVLAFAVAVAMGGSIGIATAAPCLIVTLTGTRGGPSGTGTAGAGTLVRYGEDSNECGAVKLQFDVGSATTARLSQIGVEIGGLNAIFFTHMHSDHTDGFADLMQLRWHYYSTAPKVDVVCSADVPSPLGFVISCKKFAMHIGDPYLQSGEINQRHAERKETVPGGPADLINVINFDPTDEPQVVWSSGDVKVSAIKSAHMPGHASYRVDTPAGSVVIGGDAANDKLMPPRAYSTSDQVERLAKGADILVHSTTHPVIGPDKGGGMPAPIFFRQSTATDLGAMAQRAGIKYFMTTHMTPALGQVERIDHWKVPGAPLTEADYRKAIEEGGFTGKIIVGTDLTSLRIPAK